MLATTLRFGARPLSGLVHTRAIVAPRRWNSSTPQSSPSSSAPPPPPSNTHANVTQQTATGARNKSAVGVFTPAAAALFVLTGAGLFFYFQHEKKQMIAQREAELSSRSVGRAHVGGPFSLSTHEGKPYTEANLKDQWTLLYFGFTNCPDICPAELDKMGSVVDTVEKTTGIALQPVFISVDPARDSNTQITRYLQDFHPRFVGLTGTYDAVKSTCKAYRVYFSTPPGAKAEDDYLVDHSIFIYLLDPNGEFVEAFGQVSTVDDVVRRTEKEVGMWKTEQSART